MNRALSAGLALAVALAAGCTPSKESCHAPSIKCGDRCLDVSSDPANCGACGHACAAGSSCCAGTCVEVAGSDPANCGACGHACPANGVCAAGACSCPAAEPTQCGSSPGVCADTTLDPQNCGTCGERCAGPGVLDSQAVCTASSCVCAGTADSTDCGGNPRCVNTNTDERNCGGCGASSPGHVCKTNAICTAGACGCTSAAFPDSCPAACVNLLTDRSNCGSCGNACAGTCSGGLCCASGQTNCSGACVDTQTTDLNCGACGHACNPAERCVAGACACQPASPVRCGGTCCAGTACCAGSVCQTKHSNGLGGFFYDCHAPYAPSETTSQLAQKAADAFGAGADVFALCGGDCLGRQVGTTCAIWCYGLSTYRGHATSGVASCASAAGSLCLAFQGSTPTWQ